MENGQSIEKQVAEFLNQVPSPKLRDVKKAIANAIDRRTVAEHIALSKIAALLQQCPEQELPVFIGVEHKQARTALFSIEVYIEVDQIMSQMGWEDHEAREWVYKQVKCLKSRQKVKSLPEGGKKISKGVREAVNVLYQLDGADENITLH